MDQKIPKLTHKEACNRAKDIIALRAKGYEIAEIADALNVKEESAAKIINSYGFEHWTRLYIAYTRDQYELPLAVAGSVEELAAMVGLSRTGVLSMLSRSSAGYIKVWVRDDN